MPQVVNPEDYEESVRLFASLAHPLRLTITHLLADEPRDVTTLTELLGSPQPLVSHHLRILRDACVVTRRRLGRSTLYELADDHVATVVRQVHQHTKEPHDEHDH